jgi:hypothetical protein
MPTSWLSCWHDLTRLYKKETTVLFYNFLLAVKEIPTGFLQGNAAMRHRVSKDRGLPVKWRPL